ncbi:WhiB family transcriptional regulator [Microbacterium sp. YY-01]|uniref:WhiB family transcriptional regulator n=1 Tax=Microbacterium sp. YY-01 TaxID=3421634 RepID=UPI003D1791B6
MAVSTESMLTPQPWMRDALCAETDPEAFFAEKGESVTPARTICASCTVQPECLTYALETRQQYGIWGGLTARERADMRRRMKKEAA